MDINELSARIQKKYREPLAAFRGKVFGPEGHSGPHNEKDPDRRLPHLGPVRSLWDKHVDLTLGGDVSDLGWLMEDPSVAGTCVTISIAGHHRVMGGRTSLPSGECDAWVQAIFDPEWMDDAYRAGTLSGVDGRLSTVYYRLFLDEAGKTMDKPANFNSPELRKMSEL
ncbi:hypothetical protein [Paeniglutamicibacter sp. NPDC091659]|uniref:hypothetical protein n=1 Tax=Paeniglutamicibacter sp. NPDC091659 TaxID=3364389 RepID=UPI00382B160E